MPKRTSASVPSAVEPFYAAIVNLTERVCGEHLNEEYAELAQHLTATLARKRPSPILRGRPEIWACGILYALGTVNFLFDKSQTPHIRADDLCAVLGVSVSSGANKAGQIRDMFHMSQMDPHWCLPSMVDQNPLIWILQVNGLMVDIRHMPREVQEIAYKKGLIPYIPADRAKVEKETEAADAKVLARRGRNTDLEKPRCGLCGKTKNLTKTKCCGQWICDDEDQYVLFSYARNSCNRNHDRYTLCSYHHNEGHTGDWKTCQKCREDFESEIYVYYGTNEYNFEKLENPPDYEPTRCAKCNQVIVLSEGGYSMRGGEYYCANCSY
jgi:hypothetical protein